ncbi:MAG: hypothetical protein KR126chlam2_00868 [Chlamydiae bacterium]|nr:hypothetical protein [Chlamydiota bacterium]
MKFWDRYKNWDEAEKAWDEGAKKAAETRSLKKIKKLPMVPAIAEKHLKWKSFNYLFFNRRAAKVFKQCLKHPVRYGWRLLKSIVNKESYRHEGEFFFYGVGSIKEFVEEAKKEKALVIVGFSFCQKPLECPASRFSDKCIADPDHPVCRQCDIGKVLHTLPDNRAIPVLIPTIHYIGEKMFEMMDK